MTYSRRTAKRWREGGRTFERRGMVIREVRRCPECGSYYMAREEHRCGSVVPFAARKEER